MGEAMTAKRVEIEMPGELWADLMRVAAALGISDEREVCVVGLGEWVAQRRAELDDRDPDRKYIVNEALDELLQKKNRK